jgi:Cu-processing system permease protein
VVLGAMYLYSSREYIELLLTQPIERSSLFLGLYGGLALPLVLRSPSASAALPLPRRARRRRGGSLGAAR